MSLHHPPSTLAALGRTWVEAWNSRDLERVLTLYDEDAVMTSDRIPMLGFDASGTLRGKAALRAYWGKALGLITNLHFTLKENTLKRSDLDDFVACYNPKNRIDRKESERFKAFTYEDLVKRDKVNLDIFWLKDEALEESANLPAPEIIAQEIAADLEAVVLRCLEKDPARRFPSAEALEQALAGCACGPSSGA